MPPDAKEILDNSVDGQESLRLSWRFEPAHVPLSLSSMLMRDFSAVVGVAVSVVGHMRQNGSERRSITLQLVGDDPKWLFALISQQSLKESLGCTLIPTRLNQNVDDVAVLIDRTP